MYALFPDDNEGSPDNLFGNDEKVTNGMVSNIHFVSKKCDVFYTQLRQLYFKLWDFSFVRAIQVNIYFSTWNLAQTLGLELLTQVC